LNRRAVHHGEPVDDIDVRFMAFDLARCRAS
jgi:hypothetical protein